ncbi:unnamed protein product [Brachionus calyciflorus]|uniref:Chitin-binding type-2 domain-containing protein n=1 Tax=Brachionus calyciflorus TaxID=104777 RepID=A0A814MBU2_9BILA|nr:unnamed protein product [Brachionus calyciflorus]
MIKIIKVCFLIFILGNAKANDQQYWENVNRLLMAASYLGLDSNALAAQINQRQTDNLQKQTISSTNTENNGLGAFIGSYKENSTEIQKPPESFKPENSNVIEKPENFSNTESQSIFPPQAILPQPLPLSDVKPQVQKPEVALSAENKEPNILDYKPSNMGLYFQNSPLLYAPPQIPQFHPLIFNQPIMPFPFPFHNQFNSFTSPVSIPFPVQNKPIGNTPFSIQQPTYTLSGDTIVENLIGGLNFDCQGKVTGHYRDLKFCDVFHACVFGQRKKTYSCPYVGEAQYFDDSSRRCEFIKKNPLGCASNAYFTTK